MPESLHHAFSVVVADPPYLVRLCLGCTGLSTEAFALAGYLTCRPRMLQAEECLEKTAVTMRLLAKDGDGPKFYLLTGAVMRPAAAALLHLRPAAYRPQHQNKLGNEFLLYTNVTPSARLGGWDDTHNELGEQ